MKVSVVAIHHPEFNNLFLHGRRRVEKTWTIPGGGQEKGETPAECASRELWEETGLRVKGLKYWGKRVYDKPDGKVEVSLFIGKCPKDLNLKVKQDPDSEMDCFKFLDPISHSNLHIPIKYNILREYLNDKRK